MPYIYKITNLINNKVYVGKTSHINLNQRFQEHIQDSRKKHREKRPLYDAFNKYGIENFQIELLEKVADDALAVQQEQYWIKQLNSYIGFPNSNGYNATLGGDGTRIYDYTLLANAYKLLGTITAVCLKYGCDPDTVRQACQENNVLITQYHSKRIQRIDKNGNIVEYNSVSEAAKDFPNKAKETARKNISRALNKQQTGYGYIWKYI